MMTLSSSALYRSAAGLKPAASGSTTVDSHCVMCAAPLPMGTIATPVDKNTFGSGFNNTLDLRARTGRYVCGDCEPLWCQDWMQKYSKTFACEAGVFKLASNEHLAGFLANPPEPPFCAIFSTKQQQHMIWRTPVSLSKDYFVVRLDSELLTIRRPLLMEAWRAFRHAESVMASTALTRTGRKLKPPAAIFSRELATPVVGLRSDVEDLLRETGNGWVIDVLARLLIGEWWGLGALRHFDPASPPGHELALEA